VAGGTSLTMPDRRRTGGGVRQLHSGKSTTNFVLARLPTYDPSVEFSQVQLGA
jgi:hypothetical protein